MSEVKPTTYSIVIDVDWAKGTEATVTVIRAGQQIYRGKFDSVPGATARALFEIRADQTATSHDDRS